MRTGKMRHSFFSPLVPFRFLVQDAPGEWLFDPAASTLYLYPNATGGVQGFKELVAPLLDTLISIKGAKDVMIEGIDFTETRATYLEQCVFTLF